jgi:hypothetical protein
MLDRSFLAVAVLSAFLFAGVQAQEAAEEKPVEETKAVAEDEIATENTREQGKTVTEEIVEAEEAGERGLTMQLMDALGVGDDLDNAGINMGGVVEAGYTYSFGDPVDDEIVGRAFDFEDNELILNQLDFFIERETSFDKAWDLGFNIELMYGRDARFSRSNGFLDDDEDEEPDSTEFDITQLYGEVVIPLGKGVKTRIGKFITPLGYETVMPVDNAFYSHSFIFGLVPFAQTGVTFTYPLSDQWEITGGVSRGWDQAGDDNNDAIDGIGVVTYNLSEETSMTFSTTIGPELDDNTTDYRYAFDYYITHQATDNLFLAADATWVFEENTGQVEGDDSSVFGIAGYVTYTLNEMFDLNGRAEWMTDTNRADGFDANLYEITAGVTIRPFPSHNIGRNLLFRPELRYDFSDEDVYDDGKDYQFTFGIDAMVLF